jgi:hypothetical protein
MLSVKMADVLLNCIAASPVVNDKCRTSDE